MFSFVLSAVLLVNTSTALGGDHLFALHSPAHYPVSCNSDEIGQFALLAGRLKSAGTLTTEDQNTLKLLIEKIPNGCLSNQLKEDLRAVGQWLQLVPCDLSALTKPVRFILSSEIHTAQPRELIKGFVAKAASKKALVGFETNLAAYAGAIDFTVAGINWYADGEYAHAAHILLSNLNRLFDDQGDFWLPFIDLRPEIFNFRSSEKQVEEMRAGVQAIQQARYDLMYRTKSAENLSTTVESVIEKISGKDFYLKTAPSREAALNEHKRLREIAKKLALETVDQTLERLKENRFRFINLPPIIEGFSSKNLPLSKADQAVWSEQEEAVLGIGWRDRNLTASGVDLLCSIGNSGIEEIILHVGLAHTPGVYKLLKKTLENSKADKRVSVAVDMSVFGRQGYEKYLSQQKSEFEKIIPKQDQIQLSN
jgi:hypothetical protein